MEQGKKLEIWRGHVAGALRHPGGIAEYCRAESIGESRLHYWKKKLQGQGGGKERQAAAFARVEVIPARRDLPDPKWLADFLLALGDRR